MSLARLIGQGRSPGGLVGLPMPSLIDSQLVTKENVDRYTQYGWDQPGRLGASLARLAETLLRALTGYLARHRRYCCRAGGRRWLRWMNSLERADRG